MVSTTNRTIKAIEKDGGIAGNVERMVVVPPDKSITVTNGPIRFGGFASRFDLFGFLDIVAITGSGEVLGVQATTKGEVSTRFKKITQTPLLAKRARKWLSARGSPRIQVWGWWKKDGLWEPRIVEVKLEDLTNEDSSGGVPKREHSGRGGGHRVEGQKV